MASDTIRIGIIGCGGMGASHVQAAISSPLFDFVAGCDINRDATEHLPKGVARYTDAAQMLAEQQLDLVSIIVPSYLYEPLVKLACDRGVNVLCEKPFGHNIASARSMVVALEAAGLRGWVSAQRKYHAHFVKARELVSDMNVDFIHLLFTYFWSPAFGDMSWRGDVEKSGGIAIIDTGWHPLDLLDWFMGAPATVFCQLGHLRHAPGIDDKAALLLRYPSGALASVTMSYTMPRGCMNATFVAGPRSIELSYEGLVGFEGAEETSNLSALPQEDLVGMLYGELAKAFAGDPDAYITDMYRGTRIMRVVSACYESARWGRVVELA